MSRRSEHESGAGLPRAGVECDGCTWLVVHHDRVVSLVEKELISQVLRSCQGVQTKAATRLGINRNTLHKKIDDYRLDGQEGP